MAKLNIQTAEELRSGFVPTYNPFFSIIAERKEWAMDWNLVNISTSKEIGDVLARKIGISDTERKQVISGRTTKSFKKELKGIKYIVNSYQAQTDYQQIVNRVVNKNLMQFDREVWRGSDNNGLFISSDGDFHTNGGVAVATLENAFDAINNVLLEAEVEVGNGIKTIAPYGAMRTYLNTFNTAKDDTYLNILKRQFPNVKFVEVPQGLVDSGEKGFLCLSDGFYRLHYTEIPKVLDNGQNDEDNYVWTNIGYGTANIEVIAPKGIIKQPMN